MNSDPNEFERFDQLYGENIVGHAADGTLVSGPYVGAYRPSGTTAVFVQIELGDGSTLDIAEDQLVGVLKDWK